MEITAVNKMTNVARKNSSLSFMRLGIALLFMVLVLIYSFMTSGGINNNLFLAIAALFGAYMAMNIGANDVANAVGPLAAINDAVMTGGISSKAGIPLWVMGVGALGIAIGLALYGPKLIKTVGSENH